MSVWIVPVVAALAVPLTILAVNELWQTVRADEQVADALREEIRGKLEAAEALDAATAALGDPCPAPLDKKARSSFAPGCVSYYAERLRAVDAAIVHMSWAVDTLPLSAHSYARATAVKNKYWSSCDNAAPDEECGYRQQLVRVIYGFGGRAPRRPLTTCSRDLLDWQTRPADAKQCTDAIAGLAAPLSALRSSANVAFCSIVIDVNGMRAEILTRRGNNAIARDMKENMKNSSCRALLANSR